MKTTSILLAAAFILPTLAFAADYNLGELAQAGKLKTFNRALDASKAGSPEAVFLNAAANDGLAWISGVEFSAGTIELETKGRNQPGQSFVGIAFHGQDDTTFDAVYLRPFNFQASEAARRNHSIQYVSMPAHDWSNLRSNHPGKYESAITPTPAPGDWGVGPGLSADYKSRSLQSCQNLTRLVRHLRRVPEWKRNALRARIPIRGWRAFRLSTASAGLARPRVRLQYQVRGSSSQAMECARSSSLLGSLNPGCAPVGFHSSYKKPNHRGPSNQVRCELNRAGVQAVASASNHLFGHPVHSQCPACRLQPPPMLSDLRLTKSVLGIPDRYTRVCITPVGVPEEWPGSPKKKPLETLVSYESIQA